MKTTRIAIAMALSLLLFALAVFGLNLLGLANFGFFAPKTEQVRYNTFKESQSYNDGMVRDLENLRMQYINATADQKTALRSIIAHRFSVYPIEKMPPDLQSFYHSIQGGQQ